MRVKSTDNRFKFNSEKFSERIKKLRLKYDLKQYEIAKAIKKTRAAYGGAENGNFIPGIEMLIAIREFYNQKEYNENLSMDYLFGFGDEERAIDQPAIIKANQNILTEKEAIIKEKNEIIEMQRELLKFYKMETDSKKLDK